MDGQAGVESPRALGSRYELRERLGAGAMGEVWRAWDRSGEQEVAAKLLRGEFARDPDIVARFVQERAILLRLDHPGIVKVRDLVVEGDHLAIVMDLVPGPDLGSLLRERGTLAPRQAVALARGVLSALQAAHGAQFLHRDVKPDNVLLAHTDPLDEQAVRLTDFGIARLAQESTVHATGLLGTPGYLPPELLTQGTVSAASDLYATGVLLYELLAGRTPFAGPGTAHTIGFRHVSMAPPRLDVPEPLWSVIAMMLAKDPAQRLSPAATADLLGDLPDDVLDAPALPKQDHPTQWTEVTTATGAALPDRVQVQDAGLDVGQTNLHAAPVTQKPVAQGGDVAALTPGAVPDLDDDGVTRIGIAPAPRTKPQVLQESATEEKAKPKWPWAVGVLVLLLVVAGGIWFFTRGGDSTPQQAQQQRAASGAPTDVSGQASFTPTATGLSTTLQGSYDPAKKALSLTVDYSAQGATLQGPFLLALPAPGDGGGECPLAAWSGDAEVIQNQPQATGITVCGGWTVQAKTLAPGDTLEVTGDVAVDLGSNPDVSTYLGSVVSSTEDALNSASQYTTSYPVQRMTGVEVSIPPAPSRTAGGTPPLKVTLYPQFNGTTDQRDPLFTSTSTQPATTLLQAVAGGYDGVKLDGCDALQISSDNRVGIRSSTTDCQIDAEVGNLSGSSSTFTISGATG